MDPTNFYWFLKNPTLTASSYAVWFFSSRIFAWSHLPNLALIFELVLYVVWFSLLPTERDLTLEKPNSMHSLSSHWIEGVSPWISALSSFHWPLKRRNLYSKTFARHELFSFVPRCVSCSRMLQWLYVVGTPLIYRSVRFANTYCSKIVVCDECFWYITRCMFYP